jgi:hypothetical protein
LHLLSPQPGRQAISFLTPFPCRTPPTDESAKVWAESLRLLDRSRIYPQTLALAPDMQLSLHPAPTNRFPLAGGRGAWGLAAPGSIALPSISSVFSRVGGPPLRASAARKGRPPIRPRSDVRTLSFVGLISGDREHAPVFGGSTPPSFRVVAFCSYRVVASEFFEPSSRTSATVSADGRSDGGPFPAAGTCPSS